MKHEPTEPAAPEARNTRPEAAQFAARTAGRSAEDASPAPRAAEPEPRSARPAAAEAARPATDDARPPTDPPADTSPGKPRLTRGREQKVLAGVCDGAGRYFGVDPVIFRVVLALLSLTGGIGLIIYGMGWLVVPQEGERQSEAHRLLSGRIEGAPLTAVLMTLVGCGLYASMLGNGSNQAFSLILLAATAGAVYWSHQRRRTQVAGEAAFAAAATAVDAPPAVKAPPELGGSPSWWREPLTKEPAYLWGPDDGPYGEADRAAWRQRKAAIRREKPWLLGFTAFLLAVLAAGIGTTASWRYQPVATSLEIGLTAALGVFATAFLIASFAGRARGGTVFFSLVTIAALMGAAALPKSGHGLGGTIWRPADLTTLQRNYERGTGTGTLDLTSLPLHGRTVTTRLNIGAGQAEVRLPRNATVHLDYDLRLGEVVLPGKVNDGVNIKKSQHRELTYGPTPGTPSAGTIDLRVEVGVGRLKVVR